MPLNRDRTLELMQSRDVEAIIASSLENVYYVSDYWSLGQQLRCGVQTFALMPLDGDPAIVAPLDELDLIVDSDTWIEDAVLYGSLDINVADPKEVSEQTRKLIDLYVAADPEADAVSALVRALEQRGLTRSTVALDTSGISPDLFELLKKKLPDAKLIRSVDLLQEIRLIKTRAEIERIRRATEITEKSMEDALEIARSDIMELDMAGMFEYSVAYDHGRVTHNLIGFQERSALPHPVPTPLIAQRGDAIRMTLGCTWLHYHSNISRTAILGRPSSSLKKRWEAVSNAQQAALNEVRPGAKPSDIYAAAESELKDAGLKRFNSYFGHGLGVECNERPWIGKESSGELIEGMVLNIDVPYLELGSGGVQVEDTILVTSDGFELLTKTERDLYIL